MPRVSVSLSQKELDLIQKIAEEREDSVAAVAREFLQLGLRLNTQNVEKAPITNDELERYRIISDIETKLFVKKHFVNVFKISADELKAMSAEAEAKYLSFLKEENALI